MAYIYPDSVVQFFTNVGITPNYENSLYFASTAEKDSYFDSVTKVGAVSKCSYQRENKGSIKVELPTVDLHKATYLRFKNQSFENKWFYAFVLQVNYINNVTTEVVYQIDPLMTWMGVFELGQCYVERQHVHNDSIGANICDEGIPCGEYIDEAVHGTVSSSHMKICIAYMNPNEVGSGGGNAGGIYSGCLIKVCDDADTANTFIASLVDDNLGDNIVNIFMCPKDFVGDESTPSKYPKSKSYSFSKPYSTVGGYTPKNKKLFCYPYKYAEVDNQEGQTQRYLYEYFNTLPDATSSGDYKFIVDGTVSTNCQLLLRPELYKGHGTDELYPIGELGMSHFPMCSWGIDTYKAWLAQQNAYYPLNLATDVGNSAFRGALNGAGKTLSANTNLGMAGEAMGVLGAIAGGVVGAATAYATDTYNNMVQNAITPVTPTQSKGQQSCDVYSSGAYKTFVVHEKSITKNYAMMIDNYFTMYGYAIKQVLTPNMNARENYTYVKTLGCCVKGMLPAEDARAIEAIFDSGCRFWKKHTNIGNYSISNDPI
jgi:hypothetical protein